MKVYQPKKAIIEFSEEEVDTILKIKDIFSEVDDKITDFDSADIKWEIRGVGIDNIKLLSRLEDIGCFCNTITDNW